MNNEIEKFNASQSDEDRKICNSLMNEINCNLAEASLDVKVYSNG